MSLFSTMSPGQDSDKDHMALLINKPVPATAATEVQLERNSFLYNCSKNYNTNKKNFLF